MRAVAMFERPYLAHRRAYAPRRWPMFVTTAALIVGLDATVRLTLLETIAAACAVAVGVGVTRWEVWRHRHPIARREYVDLRRRRRA